MKNPPRKGMNVSNINVGSPISEGKVVFLHYPKFDLFTETPDNPGKRSKLSFSVRDGNPRYTVYTNVPADEVNSRGTLYTPFNPETFLGFLDTFEKAIQNGNNTKYCIDCLTNSKEDPTQKVLATKLYFGKDKEGVCWMSLVAENRPRIIFQFKLSDYNRFTHGDGVPFTIAESSEMIALAHIRGLREVVKNMVGKYIKVYEQEAKAPRNSKPQVTKEALGVSKPSAAFAGIEDDITF
jgi:hypothetical protein